MKSKDPIVEDIAELLTSARRGARQARKDGDRAALSFALRTISRCEQLSASYAEHMKRASQNEN